MYFLTYFPRIGNKQGIKFYTSSFWKRGNYKIFILFSYPNLKQIVSGESCCGEWVVSDGAGPQSRGPHDLFGGVGCTIEILMEGAGLGVVDGGNSERCLSGVVGSLMSLS